MRSISGGRRVGISNGLLATERAFAVPAPIVESDAKVNETRDGKLYSSSAVVPLVGGGSGDGNRSKNEILTTKDIETGSEVRHDDQSTGEVSKKLKSELAAEKRRADAEKTRADTEKTRADVEKKEKEIYQKKADAEKHELMRKNTS